MAGPLQYQPVHPGNVDAGSSLRNYAAGLQGAADAVGRMRERELRNTQVSQQGINNLYNNLTDYQSKMAEQNKPDWGQQVGFMQYVVENGGTIQDINASPMAREFLGLKDRTQYEAVQQTMNDFGSQYRNQLNQHRDALTLEHESALAELEANRAGYAEEDYNQRVEALAQNYRDQMNVITGAETEFASRWADGNQSVDSLLQNYLGGSNVRERPVVSPGRSSGEQPQSNRREYTNARKTEFSSVSTSEAGNLTVLAEDGNEYELSPELTDTVSVGVGISGLEPEQLAGMMFGSNGTKNTMKLSPEMFSEMLRTYPDAFIEFGAEQGINMRRMDAVQSLMDMADDPKMEVLASSVYLRHLQEQGVSNNPVDLFAAFSMGIDGSSALRTALADPSVDRSKTLSQLGISTEGSGDLLSPNMTLQAAQDSLSQHVGYNNSIDKMQYSANKGAEADAIINDPNATTEQKLAAARNAGTSMVGEQEVPNNVLFELARKEGNYQGIAGRSRAEVDATLNQVQGLATRYGDEDFNKGPAETPMNIRTLTGGWLMDNVKSGEIEDYDRAAEIADQLQNILRTERFPEYVIVDLANRAIKNGKNLDETQLDNIIRSKRKTFDSTNIQSAYTREASKALQDAVTKGRQLHDNLTAINERIEFADGVANENLRMDMRQAAMGELNQVLAEIDEVDKIISHNLGGLIHNRNSGEAALAAERARKAQEDIEKAAREAEEFKKRQTTFDPMISRELRKIQRDGGNLDDYVVGTRSVGGHTVSAVYHRFAVPESITRITRISDLTPEQKAKL